MIRTYHLREAQHQFAQNIAAIAAEFHTHRLYNAFYETFGELVDGFVGNYELCISMAEALTDWELEHGGPMAYENAGVTWIEVVENFVEDMLQDPIETEGMLTFPSGGDNDQHIPSQGSAAPVRAEDRRLQPQRIEAAA